jgi:hypothetical protein
VNPETIRQNIIRLNLARHPSFDRLSPAAFAAIYNGIGPDAWPAELREAMTLIYCEFQELPGVHDVDFAFSDGQRPAFEASLARWRSNMYTLLADRFPLWQFWRWRDRSLAWLKLEASYLALVKFSWPAWIAAADRALSQT